MTTETRNELDFKLDEGNLISEPETGELVTRDERGRLLPGVSGNPAGRPRKGQSAPERLLAQTERRADKIINGIISQAERGNVRAFAAIWDRNYGVPKQTLQVIREDDPLASLLERMSQARGLTEATNEATIPQLPPPRQE